MKARRPSRPSPRPRGFVLLAVLVFIVLLSMVTISLLFSSRAEESAAVASAGSEQAWSAAMSGVEEALRVATTALPGTLDWQDQPATFRQHKVHEDGSDAWYFTVYAPADSESTSERRHGLSDEAGRINLNHPGLADLARIPRMTPELAQAVHRYLGRTPPLATGGPSSPAEPEVPPVPLVETPGSSPPGEASGVHGPLGSLGELLQVPGFTGALLYGEDANLNGVLDPNENDGDRQAPPDNQDGQLDRGMAQYFTLRSYETPTTRDGRRRANLNQPGNALAGMDLPPTFADYLAALRASGVRLAHPADVLEARAKGKDASGQDVEIPSGITKDELPRVLDLFTTEAGPRTEGLVNLNTASVLVLATLPGVDLSLAESIVATRSSLSPERRATIAWLYQDGIVDADRFRRIAPQLTTRSQQFQFRVVGYGVPSGRFCVLEVEIDVAGGQRRVTALRDLTKLGIPFRLIGDEVVNPGEEGMRPTAPR